MWAAIDWGVVGPVLMGVAAAGGLVVAAWEKWQKQRAVKHKNGQLSGAFKLIDELQEQLREEWSDKKSFREAIRSLQNELRESFEEKAELTRQLRDAQTTSDQLFQDNQELKRKASTSKSASKRSSAKR